MKAIPTVYDGISFRSRLEARYAQFFDELGMGWAYEVEGFEIQGRRYLPDFWLPDSRTYLEVKGPMKARSDLVALAQDQIDAETGGFAEIDHVLFVIADEMGKARVGNSPGAGVHFAKCCDCLCWYPMVWTHSWACRACGYYNGDRTYSAVIESVRLPQMQWRPAA